MNPWQHPEMDKNIHHLFALVATLCNTCGGMIFLTADDLEKKITRGLIERFQSRLRALIFENTENLSQNKINFTQVRLRLGRQRTWTAIHLKRSKPNTPSGPERYLKQPGIRTDLHGIIQVDEASHQQEHANPFAKSHVFCQRKLASGDDDEDNIQGDSNKTTATCSISSIPEKTTVETSPSSDDATCLSVVVSQFSKLDWFRNKKDWESYVHGETPTIETIVDSCSLWKPTTPMACTPDMAALIRLRWFASVDDIENTLSAVDTKEPGFAIVCKTWMFYISNSLTASDSRPPAHICDILTVTNNGRVCLWVVCSEHDAKTISYQMAYLLTTGRMLKYRLTQEEGDGDLSNLCIECRLFYPSTVAHRFDTVMKESLEMQSHIWAFCNDRVKFESLQRALALVILSKESPLRRPIGTQTAITLSIQQVEVLHNKDRVIYASGPAGSGKLYTAALLCQMYGKDNSVYICTTREFAEYLNISGYQGTVVQRDQDLLRHIKAGTFRNKACIIIDDSHNFSCTRSSMKKLFKLLNDNKVTSLYVFADNDYQSFDAKRQQAMQDCIRELSRQVLGRDPHYAYLTIIYRNTKKVASFVQSAIQDSYEDYRKIECQNVETGDGIECIAMTNIWMYSRGNDLVKYLRNICTAETYKLTEIAVLLDSSYTSDQVEESRNILRELLPNSAVQNASVFPRSGVVVDHVSSFLGLDAPLCVFILPSFQCPQKRKSSFLPKSLQRPDMKCDVTISNPRFKVFMASRATHRAVFVVPRINAEIAKELKFDLFEEVIIVVVVVRSIRL